MAIGIKTAGRTAGTKKYKKIRIVIGFLGKGEYNNC